MLAQSFNPELIQGTVTELKTHKGRMNVALSSGAQAAAGAAAAGSFFSSSLMGRAALQLNESAVFFTCDVDGTTVSGCFSNVEIAEGDTMEFVVDYNPHNPKEAVAYAVRNPEKRHFWIAPMFENGHALAKGIAIAFPLLIYKYFIPIITIVLTGLFYFDGGDMSVVENWKSFLPGGVITLILIYIVLVFGLYISTVPKAKMATKVIAALGYDKPAYVSLGQESQDAKDRWEKEHNKPFPDDGDDPFRLYY